MARKRGRSVERYNSPVRTEHPRVPTHLHIEAPETALPKSGNNYCGRYELACFERNSYCWVQLNPEGMQHQLHRNQTGYWGFSRIKKNERGEEYGYPDIIIRSVDTFPGEQFPWTFPGERFPWPYKVRRWERKLSQKPPAGQSPWEEFRGFVVRFSGDMAPMHLFVSAPEDVLNDGNHNFRGEYKLESYDKGSCRWLQVDPPGRQHELSRNPDGCWDLWQDKETANKYSFIKSADASSPWPHEVQLWKRRGKDCPGIRVTLDAGAGTTASGGFDGSAAGSSGSAKVGAEAPAHAPVSGHGHLHGHGLADPPDDFGAGTGAGSRFRSSGTGADDLLPLGRGSRFAMFSARFTENNRNNHTRFLNVYKMLKAREYDVRMVNERPGGNFGPATRKYLAELLEKRGVLLAVCTSDYGERTASQYCTFHELNFANDHEEVTVIPLKVERDYPPRPPGGEARVLIHQALYTTIPLDCVDKTDEEIARAIATELRATARP